MINTTFSLSMLQNLPHSLTKSYNLEMKILYPNKIHNHGQKENQKEGRQEKEN